MRIGVIGCGSVSINAHLPAMASLPELEIAAVADPSSEALAAAGDFAGLPASSRHADWRELLMRPDIDAVVVATPPCFRPEIAIGAAEAGKHVLCEKPMAIAPADARRIVGAARQHDVVLAVNHNYACVPLYRQLKVLIDAGTIGDLEVAIFNGLGVIENLGGKPQWRHDVRVAGGGVLMDMLHAVYLAGWFLGASPKGVSASIDQRSDQHGSVEDMALVRYSYPTGYAMINMAWGLGPGGIQLSGSRGRIVVTSEENGTFPFVEPEEIQVTSPEGSEVITADRNDGRSMAAIHRNFHDAIMHGTPLVAPGEDGVEILDAVVGAYTSGARLEEVRLPLNEELPVFAHGAAGLVTMDLPGESVVRRRGLFGAD